MQWENIRPSNHVSPVMLLPAPSLGNPDSIPFVTVPANEPSAPSCFPSTYTRTVAPSHVPATCRSPVPCSEIVPVATPYVAPAVKTTNDKMPVVLLRQNCHRLLVNVASAFDICAPLVSSESQSIHADRVSVFAKLPSPVKGMHCVRGVRSKSHPYPSIGSRLHAADGLANPVSVP